MSRTLSGMEGLEILRSAAASVSPRTPPSPDSSPIKHRKRHRSSICNDSQMQLDPELMNVGSSQRKPTSFPGRIVTINQRANYFPLRPTPVCSNASPDSPCTRPDSCSPSAAPESSSTTLTTFSAQTSFSDSSDVTSTTTTSFTKHETNHSPWRPKSNCALLRPRAITYSQNSLEKRNVAKLLEAEKEIQNLRRKVRLLEERLQANGLPHLIDNGEDAPPTPITPIISNHTKNDVLQALLKVFPLKDFPESWHLDLSFLRGVAESASTELSAVERVMGCIRSKLPAHPRQIQDMLKAGQAVVDWHGQVVLTAEALVSSVLVGELGALRWEGFRRHKKLVSALYKESLFGVKILNTKDCKIECPFKNCSFGFTWKKKSQTLWQPNKNGRGNDSWWLHSAECVQFRESQAVKTESADSLQRESGEENSDKQNSHTQNKQMNPLKREQQTHAAHNAVCRLTKASFDLPDQREAEQEQLWKEQLGEQRQFWRKQQQDQSRARQQWEEAQQEGGRGLKRQKEQQPDGEAHDATAQQDRSPGESRRTPTAATTSNSNNNSSHLCNNDGHSSSCSSASSSTTTSISSSSSSSLPPPVFSSSSSFSCSRTFTSPNRNYPSSPPISTTYSASSSSSSITIRSSSDSPHRPTRPSRPEKKNVITSRMVGAMMAAASAYSNKHSPRSQAHRYSSRDGDNHTTILRTTQTTNSTLSGRTSTTTRSISSQYSGPAPHDLSKLRECNTKLNLG
eukprot:gb/GEZN01002736.1/.p1 GENE.gb/GEZN01002736.1/~~gb/GEZN01002736.1/.p1  ORF type:complete len:750 (+),score=159.43 gb/GEZN01002736.1/:35-2251(+)